MWRTHFNSPTFLMYIHLGLCDGAHGSGGNEQVIPAVGSALVERPSKVRRLVVCRRDDPI